MSPPTARGVDEFVSAPIVLDNGPSSTSEPIRTTIGARPSLREPGTVEVKLMTMTPRTPRPPRHLAARIGRGELPSS